MSPKKTKIDIEEEALKKKVKKMYENYGIDLDDSEDGELTRVFQHYKANPEQLEVDLDKSKKHSCLDCEEKS